MRKIKKLGKLIKLSDTRYIAVDGSEIKEGFYHYFDGEVQKTTKKTLHYLSSSADDLFFNVTHSFGKELEGVINAPLSEAEEALFGYSVEKMAEKYFFQKYSWTGINNLPYKEGDANQIKKDYANGFKTHQELTKDKLFTVDDMRKAFKAGSDWQEGRTILYPDEHGFIKSLLPKTEWDIEIDEKGKIKLKSDGINKNEIK